MVNFIEIVDLLKPISIIGDTKLIINDAIQLGLSNDRKDVIMWASTKNKSKMLEVRAGLILCAEIKKDEANPNCTYLLCDNPRLAFQKVLANFFVKKQEIGISPSAFVDSTSVLGDNVFIGHNVVIEENCRLGENTFIDHNTIVKKNTVIGENVVIGSNCVIGGAGFGYEKNEKNEYVFIPHIGNVIISDNVEIGNNTCVDRAVLGSTILKRNVKIDNLVHIAHGVIVGENTLITANAMIAGSVVIGNNCWIAPSSSILNQMKIGENVLVGMSSTVIKDIKNDTTVVGNPAEDIKEFIRKKRLLSKIFKDK